MNNLKEEVVPGCDLTVRDGLRERGSGRVNELMNCPSNSCLSVNSDQRAMFIERRIIEPGHTFGLLQGCFSTACAQLGTSVSSQKSLVKGRQASGVGKAYSEKPRLLMLLPLIVITITTLPSSPDAPDVRETASQPSLMLTLLCETIHTSLQRFTETDFAAASPHLRRLFLPTRIA